MACFHKKVVACPLKHIKGIKGIKGIPYGDRITVVFSAVVLLAIGAQIALPLKPVPASMQSFAVLFIGCFYSRGHAYAAIITYLAMGMLGVPLFANFNFGIQAIIGPTGGFLIGFLVAIYPMSWYKAYLSNHITVSSSLLLCLIGSVTIFGCGYLWLAQCIGAYQAFYLGIQPFIVTEVIKCLSLITLLKIKQVTA